MSKQIACLSFAALLALAGCSEVIRNHGYAPSEDELLNIVVGADTRGTVEDVLGRPSASGVLEGGSWYYVGSRVRHFGARKPEEVDRQVVAISFTEDDTVENIERFGLEKGRVVALSRRVTTSNVRDTTFIRQLIGNFGRINLDDALAN